MLAVMSFNLWIFLGAILGTSAAFALFTLKGSLPGSASPNQTSENEIPITEGYGATTIGNQIPVDVDYCESFDQNQQDDYEFPAEVLPYTSLCEDDILVQLSRSEPSPRQPTAHEVNVIAVDVHMEEKPCPDIARVDHDTIEASQEIVDDDCHCPEREEGIVTLNCSSLDNAKAEKALEQCEIQKSIGQEDESIQSPKEAIEKSCSPENEITQMEQTTVSKQWIGQRSQDMSQDQPNIMCSPG